MPRLTLPAIDGTLAAGVSSRQAAGSPHPKLFAAGHCRAFADDSRCNRCTPGSQEAGCAELPTCVELGKCGRHGTRCAGFSNARQPQTTQSCAERLEPAFGPPPDAAPQPRALHKAAGAPAGRRARALCAASIWRLAAGATWRTRQRSDGGHYRGLCQPSSGTFCVRRRQLCGALLRATAPAPVTGVAQVRQGAGSSLAGPGGPGAGETEPPS